MTYRHRPAHASPRVRPTAPATLVDALLALLLVALGGGVAAGQYRPTPPSSVLLHDLRKLRDVSSALFVAAHPDDENTRLIAYLANDALAETAYLSLTRGDGGQNLIGPHLREGLGVVRTQELLAARRTDGGTQFFTRANDFGFSKHPDETFTFWERDSILSDMVWVIRTWRPDVIVTRFHPASAGQTHGHHTASALLAVEAFELAADPEAFPEQLDRPGVEPWRAKRVVFNTSWWFYGSRDAFEAADKAGLVAVDAGGYYPLLGASNGEIAAKSRSRHLSQGFGSGTSRGSELEYLELLAGEPAAAGAGLFDGVDDTWGRLEGGAAVGRVLAKAEEAFDPAYPALAVPDLLEALRLMRELPPGRYTRTKIPALERLVADCLGVYVEATAPDTLVAPGQRIPVAYEVTARASALPVSLRNLTIANATLGGNGPGNLPSNEPLVGELSVAVPSVTSNPYWLEGPGTEGMYPAPDYDLRGLGENPTPLRATFALEVMGTEVPVAAPVLHKAVYPDRGEVYRPVLTVPAAGVAFAKPVALWPDGEARDVTVVVESFAGERAGVVALEAPAGWTVSPTTREVALGATGEVAEATFSVAPPAARGTVELAARFVSAADTFDREVRVLRYGHIPPQAIIRPAGARAVRLDLARAGERIGYVVGAGDAVPEALREVGYAVEELGERDVAAGDLSGYDAIVLGVRAYNTQDWLARHNDRLLDYARAGGTLVVQYNTSRRLDMGPLAPYPLTLSRDRVTVEGAPVTFLAPEAAVLKRPNPISAADFEGWVQERGLYFPGEWDEAYTPILASADPGEDPLEGGLLVAELGEGHYVYTGLSFFRELPAGVPGAYRLFVNLLEL